MDLVTVNGVFLTDISTCLLVNRVDIFFYQFYILQLIWMLLDFLCMHFLQ